MCFLFIACSMRLERLTLKLDISFTFRFMTLATVIARHVSVVVKSESAMDSDALVTVSESFLEIFKFADGVSIPREFSFEIYGKSKCSNDMFIK